MLEKGPYRRDREAAELLAIDVLRFLAGQPEELSRFLALSGIGPGDIRAAAREPRFLAGVLEFLLADEPLLLSFSAANGSRPGAVDEARRALDGA
jgi:hypothetical protein